jgi:iron complex outermembrane recepter protein
LIGSEIGYRTLLGRGLYIDVSAFYNKYNDLYGYGPGTAFFETSPAPAHLVLQLPLANALRGDTDGIEIAPDWKPFRWGEIKGSYSFLQIAVHDKPGFTDNLNTVSDNGSSPHHQVELQPLFNLPKKIEFDATYRYVSSLSAQAVKAYQTADFRLGWLPYRGFEISFVGQNLFQPRHPEFGGDDGPLVGVKRSFYGKVTFHEGR